MIQPHICASLDSSHALVNLVLYLAKLYSYPTVSAVHNVTHFCSPPQNAPFQSLSPLSPYYRACHIYCNLPDSISSTQDGTRP